MCNTVKREKRQTETIIMVNATEKLGIHSEMRTQHLEIVDVMDVKIIQMLGPSDLSKNEITIYYRMCHFFVGFHIYDTNMYIHTHIHTYIYIVGFC